MVLLVLFAFRTFRLCCEFRGVESKATPSINVPGSSSPSAAESELASCGTLRGLQGCAMLRPKVLASTALQQHWQARRCSSGLSLQLEGDQLEVGEQWSWIEGPGLQRQPQQPCGFRSLESDVATLLSQKFRETVLKESEML